MTPLRYNHYANLGDDFIVADIANYFCDRQRVLSRSPICAESQDSKYVFIDSDRDTRRIPV